MDIFVVERFLTGWTEGEVDALLRRLDHLRDEFVHAGLRYRESIVMTLDETCLSIFDGPDADTVRDANLRAGVRTDRVVAGTLARLAGGEA
jgi:hypothetical protein